MLLSSRKDSHDYQLMPEVDLDTKQDLLIEKEVYSSFNGVYQPLGCHLHPAGRTYSMPKSVVVFLCIASICGSGSRLRISL